MSKFDELKQLLEDVTPDFTKFNEKGNKTAGVRVRKTLQEVKKLAQELRIEISQANKN